MPQLVLWLTFIEEFDYEVVYCNGKKQSIADGLSRMTFVWTDDQPGVQGEVTDSDAM